MMPQGPCTISGQEKSPRASSRLAAARPTCDWRCLFPDLYAASVRMYTGIAKDTDLLQRRIRALRIGLVNAHPLMPTFFKLNDF